VFRRGASRELSVVIAEVESDKPAVKAANRDEKPKASSAGQFFGLAVTDLSDAQKKELKVKGGVKVEATVDAAARAGLREGDVILSLANTEVLSVKEFEAILSRQDKSKALNVLFRRGEWTQYAVIRVSR
jgi:serine protease Do